VVIGEMPDLFERFELLSLHRARSVDQVLRAAGDAVEVGVARILRLLIEGLF